MPGIPINELVTLNKPILNNCASTYFPIVYSDNVTYKSTINQIFYNGAVTTAVIADNAVTTIKIADDAVNESKIDNNSVSTFKISDDAVTSDKLNSTAGSEAVIASVIRSGAVTTSKLDSTAGSEAVNTSVIRDCSITTAKLNTASFCQAVATNTIRNCAVTSDKLNRAVGSEAVITSTVRNDAITPSKISFINDTISINDTNLLISDGTEFASVTPTGNICVTNAGNISIKADAVGSTEIADDAVTTCKIADDSITTAKIADDSVTTCKLAGSSVTSAKLANLSVGTGNIINNAITTCKILNANVTTAKIANDAVTPSKISFINDTISINDTNLLISDGIRFCSVTPTGNICVTNAGNISIKADAVGSTEIADDAVTTAKIADDAVTTAKIADDAITPSKISFINNTICTNDTNILISDGTEFASVTPTGNICVTNTGNISIKAGTVGNSELANDAVTTCKILDGSVTPAKLANSSVGTSNICNNAVGTNELADNSVTTDILNKAVGDEAVKTSTIANDAVTTCKILDDNVTTAKIANDAVIDVKIKDNNVTSSKIADDAVTSPKIADDAVTSPKIANSAVGNSELATDAVIEVKIKDGNVTSRKIASSAVGSDQIANEAVIGSKIPDNTIDNTKINNSCNYTINGLDITSPNLGINSVDYKFPSSATDGRFLQHTVGGNLEWVLPSNFEPQAGAVVLNKVLPVGTILPYGSETLPTDGKFLPCDGTERLKTQYQDLFAIIGNQYGTPSSSGYFKLPNLQGRVPIGNGDDNDGTDSCTFELAAATVYGGKYNHTLTTEEIADHIHKAIGDANGEKYYAINDANTKPGSTGAFRNQGPGIDKDAQYWPYSGQVWGATAAGGQLTVGQSHNNIQPYTVTSYIIKAIPDEVIQYNPNITAGLSALNGAGQQTTSVDLSTTEIGLNVSDDFSYTGAGSLQIANCSIMPDKLSQGAPRWNEDYTLTTGDIFTNGESLNVNYWGTGNRNSYIDFHAQGTAPQGSTIGTGYDYDARLIRTPGIDGEFKLTNKGTGPITVDRTIDQINTNNKSIVTKEYVDDIGYPAYKATIPQSSHVAQSFTFLDPTQRVLYPSGVTIPGRNLSYIVSNGSWKGSGSSNDLFVRLSIQFFNSKGQALSSKYSDTTTRAINTSNGYNQTVAGEIVLTTFTLTN